MKPLTADYLKRSEALEFRMSNMKETLFNQITAEEFDLISGLGKGEIKIPRYFFLAETEEFEPETNIRFIRTRTTVLNVMVIILYSVRRRRQYYFYNRTKNQSVVGIGEVSKHIHENHQFLVEQIVQ